MPNFLPFDPYHHDEREDPFAQPMVPSGFGGALPGGTDPYFTAGGAARRSGLLGGSSPEPRLLFAQAMAQARREPRQAAPAAQRPSTSRAGAPVPAAGARQRPSHGVEPWRAQLPNMVEVTLDRESGNRDRDAHGRVVTSPRGAVGRMQVMPGTNTDPGFGVRPARDDSLEERARVGRDYLTAMMDRYDGDPARAWAAYNMGPGGLDRLIRRHGANWRDHLPGETRAYVDANTRRLEEEERQRSRQR